jgi:catechol 2,3-dioxygenase-like lactoylglutathione lyase family enzyme
MAEDRPVLDQVNLVVRNMAEMTEFYATLGLEVPLVEPPWDGHHTELGVGPGSADFELDSFTSAVTWNQGWKAGTTGAIIGFRLASRQAVDDTYAALTTAGHAGQLPPYDAFWGSRYAIVVDPDGNAVGLMSPPDPARRTPPPDPGGGSA